MNESSQSDPRRIRVVYITSISHSGSTLLDLLISSHSRVVSVGEIKRIGRRPASRRCTCGAASAFECPFWMAVGRRMTETAGIELDHLSLLHPDEPDFERHNLSLFEAVRDRSGCDVIVDSSKDLDRLLGLLQCSSLDLAVIHLVRSPFGVAHSMLRKGSAPTSTALRWARRTLLVRRLLRLRRHLEVRYEDLVDRPADTIARVMAAIGLDFETDQLDFASRTRHNVGGNRMRFNRDSTIVHDRSWRSGLSVLQKIGVAAATLPALLPGSYWIYQGLHSAGLDRPV